jgi:hypothetical protein
LADVTLPITLPLATLGAVSGVADLAGLSVFGLGDAGTAAIAMGSGASSTAIDLGECLFGNVVYACAGAAIGGVGVGLSMGGFLASGAIAPGLLASLGYSLTATGAVWDMFIAAEPWLNECR